MLRAGANMQALHLTSRSSVRSSAVAPIAGILLALCVTVFGVGEAAAQKGPEKRFAGQVLLSDKRFPTTAKSEAAYVAAIKKQAKTNFQEDKETQSWKIFYLAFLKAPLADVQYTVKMYDISGKQQSLLATMEQFSDSRGQRTIASSFTLERKTVGVNKQVLFVVESGGRIAATTRFKILGEREHFSGKVDFSDDDGSDEGDKPATAPKGDKAK